MCRMSALGQKQTCAVQKVMSALPPKADMCSALAHVCFVPKADIRDCRRCRERTDIRVRVSPVNKPAHSYTEGFSDQGDFSVPPARLPGDGP